MSAPSQFFTPPGGPQLRVDDSGGTGLPVLFLHGLCGNAGQAAEVFPRDDAFRRITLEARGHGKSSAGDLDALSIATFASDATALIEARGLAPLVVGGISMGAAIAMRLAVIRSDLVRGLVIARPAWSTRAAPDNMRPNAEVGDLLCRFPADQALAIFNESAAAARLAVEAPDNLASLRGFFTRPPGDVTAALLKAISADGPDVNAAQLKSISVPTLIIGHRFDSVHPFWLAQDLARLIPGASMAEITPKAQDRNRYVAEFQAALHIFLKGFLP
jgi:pimeloyl-ACP methyl ester carboxylesterase